MVLENISFNSISCADDLLLMSTSKDGLQRCLDKLPNGVQKLMLVNEVKGITEKPFH